MGQSGEGPLGLGQRVGRVEGGLQVETISQQAAGVGRGWLGNGGVMGAGCGRGWRDCKDVLGRRQGFLPQVEVHTGTVKLLQGTFLRGMENGGLGFIHLQVHLQSAS